MKNQTITVDADKAGARAELRRAWSEERAAAKGAAGHRHRRGSRSLRSRRALLGRPSVTPSTRG